MVKWLRLPNNLTELKSIRRGGDGSSFIEMLSKEFPATDHREGSVFSIVIRCDNIRISSWGQRPYRRISPMNIFFKDLT
jgi:hypothetical protein